MRKYFLFILFFSFAFLPMFGFAQTATTTLVPQPKYALPCILQGFSTFGCPDITTIPGYISRLYQFAIGVSGIIAVGMIVVGGIFISISGSVDKKSEGKDMITQALLGLALLLGSWLILNTLNPALIKMEIPNPTSVGLTGGTSTLAVSTKCDAAEQKTCDGKKLEGGYTNWYHSYLRYKDNGEFMIQACVKYASKDNSLASSTYTLIPFPSGRDAVYKPC